jgi:hypothetical protein
MIWIMDFYKDGEWYSCFEVIETGKRIIMKERDTTSLGWG